MGHRFFYSLFTLALFSTMAGCSGSGNPSAFSLNGQVSGLRSQVVLSVNYVEPSMLATNGQASPVNNEVTVQENGAQVFLEGLSDGSSFSIVPKIHPLGQHCELSGGSNGDGSGTINGSDINDISINCNDYSFTLWVETNNPPDTKYYDQLAQVLTSNPNFIFNKVLVRVNGDGAASGEDWYDSMNPQGNSNDPYILQILLDLEQTNIEVYAIPYFSKKSDELWDIYSGFADDAPDLASWWTSLGVTDDAYAGSLKQSIKWISDINTAAQNNGITKTFTGIVFEPEGAPYPNDDRTLKAIATYKQQYQLPDLKVAMTGAASQGSAYANYGNEGILNEGYLQLYNLTWVPKQDPDSTYIDTMADGAISGNVVPAFPDSIYSQAWLSDPNTAAQTIWTTDPNTWKPGQNMGFQHSHDPANNIGLLNWDFYNSGNGYSFKCVEGENQCATIYFMFSTECGDGAGNVPNGIQCDCLMAGCPQSRVNAFGTWSTSAGAAQFLQFIELANADWQLPLDQFAIFQYQLLPNTWINP